ncbi:MAG: hypothetical protein HFJ42_03750 [Clostridia bacterium]|nr:hypothetical protein [Clostridia bacterium]
MEYTKDVVFNVQYGQAIKLRERKHIKRLIKIYNSNKFIINTLSITTILIAIDICMVSSFINLLVTL